MLKGFKGSAPVGLVVFGLQRQQVGRLPTPGAVMLAEWSGARYVGHCAAQPGGYVLCAFALWSPHWLWIAASSLQGRRILLGTRSVFSRKQNRLH